MGFWLTGCVSKHMINVRSAQFIMQNVSQTYHAFALLALLFEYKKVLNHFTLNK